VPKAGEVTVAVLTPKRGKGKGKLTITNRAKLPGTLTILTAKGRGKAAGTRLIVLLNRAATGARLGRISDLRGATIAVPTIPPTEDATLSTAGQLIAETNLIGMTADQRKKFCMMHKHFGLPTDEYNFDATPLFGNVPAVAAAAELAKAAKDAACGNETATEAKELSDAVKPSTTTPPPNPTPTPTPTPTECSGTVKNDPMDPKDIDDDDPCTNAPGPITQFTVMADKGPITNFTTPAGFTCSIASGTLTCNAATPVDPTTHNIYKVEVSGGTYRCPGLTMTVTDTFTTGATKTFSFSC
jgi:hypothetical protein